MQDVTYDEALAAARALREDLEMLRDGDWCPDDASCDSSLSSVHTVIKYMLQVGVCVADAPPVERTTC